MKNIWKPYSEKFVTVLINQNKDKNEKDINTLEIKKLINILREKIENTTKIICKNVEIALEMSELEEFHLKIEENIKTKEKKRPGRPKKCLNDNKNQIKIDTFYENKK